MKKMIKPIQAFITVFTVLLLAGCESAYYSAMDKVGYAKREIMVDRIENVAEAQQDAQEQFKSALEQFSSVVNFEGGDLEKLYNKLNDEYEDSVSAAEGISDRIESVESVSQALFDEWEDEIQLYSSATLKNDSMRKLNQTKRDYGRLIKAMRRAESTLQPVLNSFQDQVLYLKHNLNARAIASLKGELRNIDGEVNNLIKTMDASIAEAQSFITTLKSS